MTARIRAATPIGSCPDCLSWGSSYGSGSYCRACYDFTRRYRRGECAGCRRIIAVKKGHCRLCWLQAGIAAAGRRRITPADFRPGGDQQLSPGGMIAWSELPPALHSRDLSVTRTAEILGLAGLLHDDRVPSFTSLIQARLAVLPAPMATDVGHWLRTRSEGGPRSRPRNEHTVRMNLNRVHPLLLDWA